MQTCPDECVMCQYDRHTPIDQPPGYMEAAIVGIGLASSAWISVYVLWLIGDWIARTGLARVSFVASITTGAAFAVFAAVRQRR